MNKLIAPAGALVMSLMMSSAAAWADAGSAEAPVPVAAGSASAPAPVVPVASDARKACTDAMNADPKFAASIVQVADEKAAARRDEDTLAAHNDAYAHIQKNEKHVIYGYAAMWIVAALFVLFLWRRQQGLTAEIASLRRDLETAVDEGKGNA